MLRCSRNRLGVALLAAPPSFAISTLRAVAGALGQTSCRRYSTQPDGDDLLHFCIVGSGPAGFYTADKLLKQYGDKARINILDRLPTPFGLVRSGVAPDHPDTKNVINQYTATASDPRVTFFGNVAVGDDISLGELRQAHNAVVMAYGAGGDKALGVPGEALGNVLSARQFVQWYNGHPDNVNLPIDLTGVRSVAVCGLGNVAIDCARVLLRPVEELASTDMARHALEQLRSSSVREVHLVGRRGPVQSAFTAKELRELTGLPGVKVVIRPEDLEVDEQDKAEMAAVRLRRRLHDILSKAAADPKPGAERQLHFQFLRSPVEMLPSPSNPTRVGALRVERTRLEASGGGDGSGGARRAVGTGEYDVIPVDLVLVSIGYRSVPVDGAPFDERRGIVPNSHGRVLTSSGSAEVDPGLYVSGWLKRGPSGIIGTNIPDAEETVACIAEDLEMLPQLKGERGGARALADALRACGVSHVSFPQWLQLDGVEVDRGQQAGKSREKLVSIPEMLRLVAACDGLKQ